MAWNKKVEHIVDQTRQSSFSYIFSHASRDAVLLVGRAYIAYCAYAGR